MTDTQKKVEAVDLTDMRFGRIVARLPMLTVVCDTSPPFTYYLIEGGFVNSEVPNNAKVITFLKSKAKDGTPFKHLDQEA